MSESEAAASSSTAAAAAGSSSKSLPTCVIVLGMAGSGKTTFVQLYVSIENNKVMFQRLTAHLYAAEQKPYVMNLDPAVREVPYPANIDIRDTVNYKEVMKQHKLGPNGAIMTSLNLFATRFDQVMQLIDKRKHDINHFIIDTPGQIEVFTWSASGQIITETLASAYPTVVVYVMDSARSQSPVTFMSNMVYACSILYRTRLPFIVVMNKCDIVRSTNLIQWTRDFDAFHEALQQESSYISDLSRSLSLVLDDFYDVLQCVEVSAVTGFGVDAFMKAVADAAVKYETEYKPEYERLKRENEAGELDAQRKQLEKFKLDRKNDNPAMNSMYTGTDLLMGQRIHLGNLDEAGSGEPQPTETLDSDDDANEEMQFAELSKKKNEKT